MGLQLLLRLARHPRRVALATVVLIAAALALLHGQPQRLSTLALDPALSSFVPDRGSATARFEAARKRFGDDDVLLVVWQSPQLFSVDGLTRLAEFSAAVEALPGVLRVDSLGTAPSVRAADGIIEIDSLLVEPPADEAAAQAVRTAALASPLLRGWLVAEDGTATLLAVAFDRRLAAHELFRLSDEVARLSREHAGDIAQWLTGPAHVRIEISRLLRTDLMRILPLAVGITVLVAAFAMRSLRGLVMPTLVTGGAVIGTVTSFLALGHAFNFVTVLVVPVTFIVGFAYSIHVVSALDDARGAGLAPRAAVARGLREVAGTVTLNAGLEVIGFLSFAASGIPAIRIFGLFSAVGIGLAWLGALVLVPAGYGLLGAGPPSPQAGGALSRFALRLARFDLRHRRRILLLGALATLGAVLAATRIDVGTDYLSVPPARSGIADDYARASTLFSGLVPLRVVIETEMPGAFKDPQQLAHVAELQRWLEAQPEVGQVASLVDYLGVLYHAFVPEAPPAQRLPPGRELTDQLLLLGAGNDVERFADRRFGTTVLTVRAHPAATAALAPLVARIEARLRDLPGHLHGHVTGSAVLLVKAIDDITLGQVVSLGTTALVIYAVLAWLFASFKVGAIALLPNLMPIAGFFGVLGVSGIPLDVTTSLVAPIVLAIVIDDTVHFMARYNAEARRSASEALGLERAMVGTLRPVAYSTLGLVSGFVALGASELRNEALFGLLAAGTMLLAWLIDLTFTPALASRMRFVTLWDTLGVDLGCREPQKTIPLFHGLSARQARTAAVLGSILNFEPGQRLLKQGDEARELFVVIEGEVVARVPHDDGDSELRRFHRGELLGAASLFHGRHFANAEAVGPVRVLRLGEACLGRIQARYPRIGAQLYRNLSAIMAERLADFAVRI